MTNALTNLPELASKINEHNSACEQAANTTVEHARQAGELMLQAKAQVPHGEWSDWMATNLKCSQRTGQRYMRVAREWDRLALKNDTLSFLTMQEVSDLLADTKPGASHPLPATGMRLTASAKTLTGYDVDLVIQPSTSNPGCYFGTATYCRQKPDDVRSQFSQRPLLGENIHRFFEVTADPLDTDWGEVQWSEVHDEHPQTGSRHCLCEPETTADGKRLAELEAEADDAILMVIRNTEKLAKMQNQTVEAVVADMFSDQPELRDSVLEAMAGRKNIDPAMVLMEAGA